MTTKIKRTLFPLITSMILAPLAHARLNRCSASIAATTTYYTPSAKVICNSNRPCDEFKEIVNTQGSGTLGNGKIYTHTGQTVDIGDCKTTKGKGNTCLIPYISVAADLAYNELGTIIEVPHLKGKVVNLGNGKTMRHPGYFIVDDKGASTHVVGENRFDVYTGPYVPDDPNNSFGYEAAPDMQMAAENQCGAHKTFKVLEMGSAKRREAQIAINNALRAAGEDPVYAVNSTSSSSSSSFENPFGPSSGAQ
ncbi:hypothetical protein [Bdellovibrio sp. HCB337]|uniref:hypothetical protein n=1 Tax=Bdellovibrio sp. HCB337 TaxID=3394358 RepID=UPI0039A5A4DF